MIFYSAGNFCYAKWKNWQRTKNKSDKHESPGPSGVVFIYMNNLQRDDSENKTHNHVSDEQEHESGAMNTDEAFSDQLKNGSNKYNNHNEDAKVTIKHGDTNTDETFTDQLQDGSSDNNNRNSQTAEVIIEHSVRDAKETIKHGDTNTDETFTDQLQDGSSDDNNHNSQTVEAIIEHSVRDAKVTIEHGDSNTNKTVSDKL